MSLRHWIPLIAAFAPGLANAQPTLESLWPNVDGTRWEYMLAHASPLRPAFTSPAALWLHGTTETAGGTAQVLFAEHDVPVHKGRGASQDPVLAAVWRARPDLRAAITARTGVSLDGPPYWWPLLLGGGLFMKTPSNIQMWAPDWDHPTWTYLTNNLTVGAGFTHQLVPELADNVFLHGTVESNDAVVTTPAGTFEHAVRMGYVIDYGWNTSVLQNPNGRYRAETRGHVHFVPDVGPVEMLEDFFPYVEIDCAPEACPQEWIDELGISVQTLTLALTNRVVAVEEVSWGTVKVRYQR